MEVLHGKKTNEKKGTLNKIIFILLLISILIISALVYIKNQNIDLTKMSLKGIFANTKSSDKDAEIGQSDTINIDIKDNPAVQYFDGKILNNSAGGLQLLNQSGKVETDYKISFSNPILKTCGNYAVAADYQGKTLYLLDKKSVLWSKIVESPILNCSVAEDGSVTAVMDVKGSNGVIALYKSDGTQVFTKGIGEDHVMSAQLSTSGDKILIASLNTAGISPNTNLVFTDRLGNKVSNQITLNDEVVPWISYLKGGKYVAVGKNDVVCFNDKGEKLWSLEDKYRIYGAAVVKGDYVALSVGDKLGSVGADSNKLMVLDNDGKEYSSYKVTDSVKNISSDGSSITINKGKELEIVSADGRLRGKYSSSYDIINVLFLSGSKIAIISKSYITITGI